MTFSTHVLYECFQSKDASTEEDTLLDFYKESFPEEEIALSLMSAEQMEDLVSNRGILPKRLDEDYEE